MKSSEILTRAAELVDRGKSSYAFGAISAVTASAAAAMGYFSRAYGTGVSCRDKQHRVMALLLCAAIAESEGD